MNHPAWYYCWWVPSEGWCELEDPCEPFGSPQSVAPLAAEFRVEAVEVVDETPAPAQTAEATVLEQTND